MSYTIRNLREVEDQAPAFGMGEIQEARFANDALGTKDTGVSFHVVKPGRRQGFAHRHVQAEEVYVVVAGSGRVKIAEQVCDVGPLDAIRVEATAARAFEAGPGGLELIAFGPRHQGDGEIIEGDFWGD